MKAFAWAFLAATAAALPVKEDLVFEKRGQNQDRSVSVTAADISNFALYAQYAGAAYCNSNAQPGALVTCSDHVCDAAQAAGATIVANLGDADLSSLTGMQGYVAVDPAQQAVVLSFRGSSSLRNFMADLDFAQVSCSRYFATAKPGSDCVMHNGFGVAWTEVRAAALAGVKTALQQNPSYAVVVTGHSLGGAVAQLAAAELRAAGTAVALYTYGSPRLGNQALAAFLTTQVSGIAHYRVTHQNDPVPQLPPRLFNYRHTSPEYWLKGDGIAGANGAISYQTSDVAVCEGYANGDCNASEPSVDVEAHLTYFEPIAGCNADLFSFKE